MTTLASALLPHWIVTGTKTEVSPTEQDAYQATITRLLKKENLPYWFGLVKLFSGFNKDAEEGDELMKEFSKEFPKFPVRENEHLLRVLAGCILAQKAESDSPITDKIILSLLTINFSKDKATLPLPEVLTRTEDLWKEKSKANRALPAASKLSTVPTKDKPLSAADQKQFINSIAPFFIDIEKRVASNSEETNVLSWLFSSYSRAIEASFAQIGATKLSFVGAKDLADLTIIPLGLPNARGILSKMLEITRSPVGNVHLTDIVRELNEESPYTDWVSETIKLRLIPSGESITPLLFALHCHAEYSDKADWKPTFELRTGFAAGFETDLLTFAMQFYKECMLLSIIHGKS